MNKSGIRTHLVAALQNTCDVFCSVCFGPKVELPNPHLVHESEHFLYHLGISSANTDFPSTFGDIKVSVCV